MEASLRRLWVWSAWESGLLAFGRNIGNLEAQVYERHGKRYYVLKQALRPKIWKN